MTYYTVAPRYHAFDKLIIMSTKFEKKNRIVFIATQQLWLNWAAPGKGYRYKGIHFRMFMVL